ncbi:MAG TPA: hypothetical protein VJQ79_11330 [Acidimicrobiia bacterium]|nr:hypothetical protein [Acidimicrobiia bacterium]
MELTIVDRILLCLFDQARNVAMAMRDAGYTQNQISAAWHEARAMGLTESSGLGRDRLTEAGKARCRELIDRFVR